MPFSLVADAYLEKHFVNDHSKAVGYFQGVAVMYLMIKFSPKMFGLKKLNIDEAK